MVLKAMDSLDFVEVTMVVEDVFGADIPDSDAQTFGGPREIVDWLESEISNQRPNKEARKMLKKLAEDQARPELAEHLEGTWRREQIAAVIRDLFEDTDRWY
jgi:hypothetical protein